MNAKALLSILLLFATPLLAQESFLLNIKTEDRSKFTVYINDVAQNSRPVNALDCPMRPGKAIVKVVFVDPSMPPVIQEMDCQEAPPPLTLRKKNKRYIMDGFPAVALNVGVGIQLNTNVEVVESYSSSSSSSGRGNGNNNGNNRPPRDSDNDNHPYPPRQNPYLPNGTLCQSPTLSEVAFLNIKKKISDEYYSYSKAKVALQIIESHCLLAEQVAAIVKMISAYTSEQFEVAKNGYLHMYNTEDFDIVIDAVGSKDHQKKLREFAATTGGSRQPVPHPHPFPETDDRPRNPRPGPSIPRCEQSSCRGFSMNNQDFDQALESIRTSTFEDTKLDQAKLITRNNCLSVAQIRSIIRLFTFEESKLDYAKFAFNKSHDKKNFYLVNQEFTFDTSKQELTEYMNRN